ncbi:hypothetical protein [Aquimarina megaterium]|uniref:hypothetical protein n=1 Tax=Aquimarina megaterium TaxID=1443666 RepID=UPI0004B6DA0D|nr:hypothetical protein [Aquimarina megaterium]
MSCYALILICFGIECFFIPISCHPRLDLGSTFRDGLWIPAEVYAERRRSAGMTRGDYITTNRIDAFL